MSAIKANRSFTELNHIVLANPHHLGDALMMFPLAGSLRQRWPGARITFAGLPYVEPLVEACEFFDGFIDSRDIVSDPMLLKEMGVDAFINPFPDDELARAAWTGGVPIRVGNLLRPSARFCNRFVAYNSTLKHHVLDFYGRHLRPLGIEPPRAGARAFHGLTRLAPLPDSLAAMLAKDRQNLIFHPKSGGSGREWPLESWLSTARTLISRGTFRIFITGTMREREQVRAECPELLSGENGIDLMGKLALPEFLSLIDSSNGLLAGSTGPLHMAAALGRHALGIYPAGLGLNPASWAPVGARVRLLRAAGACHPGRSSCPRAKGPPCPCTAAISPQQVLSELIEPALG